MSATASPAMLPIVHCIRLLTEPSLITNPLDDRFTHRRLSFLLRLNSEKLHNWLHRRSLSHTVSHLSQDAAWITLQKQIKRSAWFISIEGTRLL